jgi:hypothetical protein
VLSPTEQRYSTCEQELLAIVYALQKFRLYVYGRQIKVFTDNKSLYFLKRCVLTSDRIARWVMQLQEYDLEVVHISGSSNFLADILSRNPVGLTQQQIKSATRPKEITIAAIDLNLDPTMKETLKNLARYQKEDPVVQKIKVDLEVAQLSTADKYKLINDVLHCKGDQGYPYWRPFLPASLERQVIQFVHKTVGHQGTEKCIAHLAHTFYCKNLGRKVRKFISCCDVCQRFKHPNRVYIIESRSHLPSSPGGLLAIDLYGPLPTSKGRVRYLLVCLDVFSKHVKFYPLR